MEITQENQNQYVDLEKDSLMIKSLWRSVVDSWREGSYFLAAFFALLEILLVAGYIAIVLIVLFLTIPILMYWFSGL